MGRFLNGVDERGVEADADAEAAGIACRAACCSTLMTL